MNAELEAAGEERIVLLIRVLDYAQRWTAAVDWRSVGETQRELDACNAFLDPDVAEEEGLRLRMPGKAMS